MDSSYKKNIKYLAGLKKAGADGEGVELKSFKVISENGTSPTLRPEIKKKLEQDLYQVAARDKKKGADYGVSDEPSYFEEENAFSDVIERDGETARAKTRRAPSPKAESDEDILESLYKKFIPQEEYATPEEDPSFAPKLKAEQKQQRYELIKQRAEEIRKQKEQKLLEKKPVFDANQVSEETTPIEDLSLKDEGEDK